MNPALVQISDLHLMADPANPFRGIDADAHLRQVLAKIQAEESDIEALLVTGDLRQSGGVPTYRRLQCMLDEAGLPWFWLPGNHDDAVALKSAWGERERGFKLGSWEILLLDSTANLDARGGGSLTEEDLERLEVLEPEGGPVLIALHHNPVDVESSWQNAIGLGNSDRFWQCLAGLRRPCCVVFGHVHQAWDLEQCGVRLLGCPATSVQFKKRTAAPEVETRRPAGLPGYRRLQLFDNGHLETIVKRLDLA